MTIDLLKLNGLINIAKQEMPGKPYFSRALRILTPKDAEILEIGAGAAPLFTKEEYPNSKILDYYSTDEIGAHFENDYNLKGASQFNFPQIDFVCKDGNLKKTIGNNKKFDLIFSSHCIEHQPCLLNHLKQIEKIVKSDGVFVAVIPSRESTFDALRTCSTTGDVLTKYHSRTKNPSGKNVFEYYSRLINLNPGRKITAADNLEFIHNLEDAYKKFKTSLKKDTEYIDIHNWVFTPRSFIIIMVELYLLKLTKLFPQVITETNRNEFLCALSLQPPPSTEDIAFLEQFRLDYYKENLQHN